MSRVAANIYLIGHRGVGKSTVAPLAAKLLHRPWVDLDVEIERLAGASIHAIFAERGEAAFRELEAEALAATAAKSGLLVATGGGLVLREDNRRRLHSGRCVWLRARLETIVDRLRSGGRPPLTGMSLEVETAALLAVREPIYRSLARSVIDVDTLEPEVVAERIAAACTTEG
jgi:shikimate kinase